MAHGKSPGSVQGGRLSGAVWLALASAILSAGVMQGEARGFNHCAGIAAILRGGVAQGASGDAGVLILEGGQTARKEWTAEEVQQGREQISNSDQIDSEVKDKVLEIYDRALAQLKLLEQHRSDRARYIKEREAAPAQLEEIRARLGEPPAETHVDINPDATVADLEQMTASAEAAHQELIRQAGALDERANRRTERRSRIPEETASMSEQAGQIRARLAGLDAEGPPELVQASRMLLEIQAAVLDSQVLALEEELRYYNATGSLLTARRELAGRLVAESQARLRRMRDIFQEARTAQAERLKAAADAAAKEVYSHPSTQAAAEENARLAALATKVVGETESARQYGRGIQTVLQRAERDFREVKEQAEAPGGVTPVVGIMLLARRGAMPDLGPHKQRLRAREGRAAEAYFAHKVYDREWSGLQDIETATRQFLLKAGLHEADEIFWTAHAEAARLLGERREIVRKIADDYRVYADLLGRNDRIERQLIGVVDAYRQFIDERILWVRGSSAIGAVSYASLVQSLRWFGSPAKWRVATAAFGRDVASYPMIYALGVVLLGALLYGRGRMITAMGKLTERVGSKYADSFVHTWKTLGLTVALAAPVPAVLLLASWRLGAAAGGAFGDALAAGLWTSGLVVAVFRVGVFFCYPGGLGQQLGFDAEVVGALRREFQWFFPLLIPLTFLATVFLSQGMETAERNSMGRLLFVGELAVLAVFLWRVLRPDAEVLRQYLTDHESGTAYKFRYAWYGLEVCVPVALAVLAMSGYFYAAEHLYTRLVATILFIGAVIFLNAFFRRWLTVAQKRIAIRRKRQQLAARAQREESGQAEDGEKAMAATPKLSEEEHAEQVWASSRQAMRLIKVINVLVLALGLWWLWADVVPALGGLREIVVWTTGETAVSVAGLIKAGIIAALTVIVARNLPGLVEMVILQRLPFEAGSRFAITTLCRYVIVVVGVVLTFGELGIGWSKVQWLVAAMTVGLGFGLQEIFANFVSGLILLFEQPIRVGDMVTIGDVSGKVTQIRIRATTLRRYDQKEIVVPNKEFITGRLTNWSLTDKILRIDFNVGVAYGSDIAKAEATLYRVANEHPLVIHDKMVPVVVFRGFGESSLDFELRAFVPNMDNYLKVWHEINCAIDREFRKEGIEIAFPQRDLHIRSGALGVKMERPEPENRQPEA